MDNTKNSEEALKVLGTYGETSAIADVIIKETRIKNNRLVLLSTDTDMDFFVDINSTNTQNGISILKGKFPALVVVGTDILVDEGEAPYKVFKVIEEITSSKENYKCTELIVYLEKTVNRIVKV